MIQVLGIFEKLTEWSEQLKEFILAHDRSPLVYTGLFILGVIAFACAYNYLHKDN